MSDEFEELELGAREARTNNATFVNLRIGKLAETSDTQKPGFVPASTKNKAGTVFNFFAHPYDDLIGYIKDIKWHEKKFEDGGVVTGWWIILDCGKAGEFIIDLKSNDRPFNRTMATLPNVNFDKPVRFSAWMSKHPKSGKLQKTMFLYQGAKKEDGKPDSVKPAYEEKWLSSELIDKVKKIKAGKLDIDALSDQERGNLSFKEDGTINGEYPYVRKGADGKWNFGNWTDFLINLMKDEVIPSVREAQSIRDQAKADEEADTPAFSGEPIPEGDDESQADDDIPF